MVQTTGTRRTIRRCAVLLLVVATAFVVQAAQADLYSASSEYKKGDYAHAFADFLALAELGQPQAQFDVAAMYEAGQGVAQSDIHAYAWATLAAENGWDGASKLADAIRPRLAPGSERVAGWISAPYSPASLQARLLPEPITAKPDSERHAPAFGRICLPVRIDTDIYPSDEASRGVQGSVFTEFTLMPDGTARLPRIVLSVPAGVFDSAVRRSILRDRFRVRSQGAQPLNCVTYYRFVAQEQPKFEYPDLERYVADAKLQASRGNPSAQLMYGLVLVGMPQLRGNSASGLPWFLKAAQAGLALAQFEVGDSLLHGVDCHPEQQKAMIWLDLAAAQHEPNAEITLALRLLQGSAAAADTVKAKEWLESAAASGNADGELFLAAFLAAAPQPELRDPKRALDLLKEVVGADEDPTAYEIRAAAQAASGDFAHALKSERTAIRMAGKLGWNLAALEQRLHRYQADQPWYGNLLKF